jgi:hypothetical protein
MQRQHNHKEETMKELKGKMLLEDLGLKNGELVKVGKTVYTYFHEQGTEWDRLTPVSNKKKKRAK